MPIYARRTTLSSILHHHDDLPLVYSSVCDEVTSNRARDGAARYETSAHMRVFKDYFTTSLRDQSRHAVNMPGYYARRPFII